MFKRRKRKKPEELEEKTGDVGGTGGPKVDKARVSRNVKKYSSKRRTLGVMFLVIVAVVGINFWSTRELRQTVPVVKLKTSVPQEGMITEDIIYKDEMYKSEYEKQGIVTLGDGTKRRAIVLWGDRDKLINTFTSYYIRENTPVYWDSIGKETPKKFSYLYKMDGELIKVNLDATEFGEMLVPGDRINVRAVYQEQVYKLPTESEFMMQQQTGLQPQTSVQKQIMLFNNAPVLDILNSQGDSIFDIYYGLISLPKNKQEEVVQSDDFQAKVVPSQILMNVTPEEADRYMSIVSKGPQYLMSLLPRTSSNAITEVLNELQVGLTRDNK